MPAEFGYLAQNVLVFHRLKVWAGRNGQPAMARHVLSSSAQWGNEGESPLLGDETLPGARRADADADVIQSLNGKAHAQPLRTFVGPLLPPYLFRHVDRELQLRPLLFFGEEIAFFRRREA